MKIKAVSKVVGSGAKVQEDFNQRKAEATFYGEITNRGMRKTRQP